MAVKSSFGAFKLDTLRDRSGYFEPQLIKKNQTKMTDEIEFKVLSMFSLGMSYSDLRGGENILINCIVVFPEAIATISKH